MRLTKQITNHRPQASQNPFSMPRGQHNSPSGSEKSLSQYLVNKLRQNWHHRLLAASILAVLALVSALGSAKLSANEEALISTSDNQEPTAEQLETELMNVVRSVQEQLNTNQFNNTLADKALQSLAEITQQAQQLGHQDSWTGSILISADIHLIKDNPDEALSLLRSAQRDITHPESQWYLLTREAAILADQGRDDELNTLISAQRDKGLPDGLIAQLEQLAVQAQLNTGRIFPTFSGYDSSGKALSLEDYRGKVVLINFYASWCGPCRQSMPALIDLHERYNEKSFDVLGINLDQQKSAFLAFREQAGLPWRNILDGSEQGGELAQRYGANRIPKTYLLDKDGTILGVDLYGEQLELAIRGAIKP